MKTWKSWIAFIGIGASLWGSFTNAQTPGPVTDDNPPYFESLYARALPNYIVVNPNLSRSGRPDAEGLVLLKQNNVKTIINIENDMTAVRAEEAAVKRLGMQYVSSPMSWNKSPSDQQVDALLRLMTDAKAGPVHLHCKHGRDRTGMMIGLYRVFVDRWPPGKAYQEMLATGFRPQLQALDQYFKRRTHWNGQALR